MHIHHRYGHKWTTTACTVTFHNPLLFPLDILLNRAYSYWVDNGNQHKRKRTRVFKEEQWEYVGYLVVVVVDPLKLFKVLKKGKKQALWTICVSRHPGRPRREYWGRGRKFAFYRGLFCMRAILTRARLPLSEILPPLTTMKKRKRGNSIPLYI